MSVKTICSGVCSPRSRSASVSASVCASRGVPALPSATDWTPSATVAGVLGTEPCSRPGSAVASQAGSKASAASTAPVRCSSTQSPCAPLRPVGSSEAATSACVSRAMRSMSAWPSGPAPTLQPYSRMSASASRNDAHRDSSRAMASAGRVEASWPLPPAGWANASCPGVPWDSRCTACQTVPPSSAWLICCQGSRPGSSKTTRIPSRTWAM